MAGTEKKAKAKTINEETIRNRKLLIRDKASKGKQKQMFYEFSSYILQGFQKNFVSEFFKAVILQKYMCWAKAGSHVHSNSAQLRPCLSALLDLFFLL